MPQKRILPKKAVAEVLNEQTSAARLFEKISSIWEKAREYASRTVNSAHTCACRLTGLHLVESEQGGAYGAGVLKQVSERLTAKYGNGFSVSGLQYMRAFYLEYPEFLPIQHALRVKSDTNLDVTAILAPYSESPAESGEGAKQHAALKHEMGQLGLPAPAAKKSRNREIK